MNSLTRAPFKNCKIWDLLLCQAEAHANRFIKKSFILTCPAVMAAFKITFLITSAMAYHCATETPKQIDLTLLELARIANSLIWTITTRKIGTEQKPQLGALPGQSTFTRLVV